ncbi:hypothetical protein [Streptomyces sp. ST2-7A]|uniref:LppU/SCO3897 family protein n=1 Tax=Streptomyces sp. ST2-7A TaxID=2907214 RepID=UPI001F3D6373|nr:hypothetical protein [Streptomyces sp. ST2-7A]MCE7081493.1 hypothetical protein [Streptomyces sp. ST2-7A]
MSTPPPAGANPYGSSPQPGQQPPQPGYGYPQQPGAPAAGARPTAGFGVPGSAPQAGFGAPGAPGAPGPEEPKKNKKWLRAVGPVVALAIAGGFYFLGGSDAKGSEVGDCLRNEGTMVSPDMKKVDCASDEAEYKVLERVEGDTSDTVCENVANSTIQYYEEQRGRTFSLCLSQV